MPSRRRSTVKESEIPHLPKPESPRTQACERLREFLEKKGYNDLTIPSGTGPHAGNMFKFRVIIKIGSTWDGEHRNFEVWPITTKRPKGLIKQVSGSLV